VTIGIYFLLPI